MNIKHEQGLAARVRKYKAEHKTTQQQQQRQYKHSTVLFLNTTCKEGNPRKGIADTNDEICALFKTLATRES